MVPELGHFSLILALSLTIVLAIVPLVGASTNNLLWMSLARPLAMGQWVFLVVSFSILTYSFMTNDFSVALVAKHSNTLLPDYYKFSAVWGNHEGSLLLWMLILSSWTFAVSIFSRNLPMDLLARVLSVMGMIGIGFLLFLLMTSNPFERYLPNFPSEGGDLNPLLQDIGLIVHPPLLYMGYVGFSVAFAFAIAALMGGRLDTAWARWSRPWTNVAWAFLTGGIALGSWWAYYELGWGGWWFWDPVENASFMPWLAGTALVHSLAVTEKRGVFKSWTVLLALFTFSLSLLGTFLVRSGVLTSVHAFAVDPERGLFILIFLGIIVGGSLTLYALRAPSVASKTGFKSISREVLLLVNNILLIVSCASVLLGTLFPLFYEAVTGGKLSVGPPYFNTIFVPLMVVLAFFMALGPIARWRETSVEYLVNQLLRTGIFSVTAGIILPLFITGAFSIGATVGTILAFWLVSTLVGDLLKKAKLRGGITRLGPSYFGMQLAHLGFVVTLVGVTFTSLYTIERDIRMAPKDQVDIGGYTFIFGGTQRVQGPNYIADQALVEVAQGDRLLYLLKPEKRLYNASGQAMTEADIDPGLFGDVFVALGEPVSDDGAWAVRIQLKPFIRWIWFGALFMALGGILAVTDRRYRTVKKRAPKTAKPTLGVAQTA